MDESSNTAASKSAAQARLATVLPDADTARSAGLQQMVEASQAEIEALKLEQLRLKAKYGPESHQLHTAGLRLQAALQSHPVLQAELSRTQLPVPQPNPKAFILYGRVTDKNSLAVGAAKVAAIDDCKRAFAEARTGAAGDFLLTLPAGENCQTPGTFEIEITDPAGHQTTMDEHFQVKAGEVVYREFVI